MNSRIPGNYDSVFPSRNDAIDYLNNMEDWSDGWLYSVKYTTAVNGQVNNIDDIGVILAVGIKNSAECGAGGSASENLWTDRTMNHGPQFYKIVGDSKVMKDYIGGSGTSDLNTTTVHMNGEKYKVANANSQDEIISDPFKIKRIPS